MKPYYSDDQCTLFHGHALDVLREMPDESVDCIVTSPPYFGLRDYGVDGQIGVESSPAGYVTALGAVMSEARRVLASDGTLWLNLGDSYSTRKALLGIPWRVAFALQDDGWILRNDIVWAKPNGMPESVRDRLSARHEYVFLFSKTRRYWFNLDRIREPIITDRKDALSWERAEDRVPGQKPQHRPDRPQKARAAELFHRAGLTDDHLSAMRAVGMSDAGKALTTQSGAGKNSAETQRLADEAKVALGGYYREFLYDGGKNPGDWWVIPTQPFAEAHFAVFPVEIPRRCIAAGCKPGGTVLDTFSGSGTSGLAAAELGMRYIGIDLNRDYLDLSLRTRLSQPSLTAEASA